MAQEKKSVCNCILEWDAEQEGLLEGRPKVRRMVPCEIFSNMIDGEPELAKWFYWPPKIQIYRLPKSVAENLIADCSPEVKPVLFKPHSSQFIGHLASTVDNDFVSDSILSRRASLKAGFLVFTTREIQTNREILVHVVLNSRDENSLLGFIPTDTLRFGYRFIEFYQQYLVTMRQMQGQGPSAL